MNIAPVLLIMQQRNFINTYDTFDDHIAEFYYFKYDIFDDHIAVDYPVKALFQFNLSSGLHSFIYLSNIEMHSLLSAGSLEKDHVSKMVIQR